MVVATLVRRSLLHHPSNRLVLSLTGSNLILTVVVLPGMVTSLLMTPASPNNQQSTLPHHFNDSDVVSSQNSNAFKASISVHNTSSDLPKQLNVSFISEYKNSSSKMLQSPVSGILHRSFNSNSSPRGYVSDEIALSHFKNKLSVTRSVDAFITTQSPLYLEVSPEIGSPPVPLHMSTGVGSPFPLYNHRDVSILSQQLESDPPLWHHSVGNSQNLEHARTLSSSGHQQIPVEIEKYKVIYPERRLTESVEILRDTPKNKIHEQNSAKDSLTEIRIDMEDGNQQTGGKGIISRSIHSHKAKDFRSKNLKDHPQEGSEKGNFTVNKRGINHRTRNHQHSKSHLSLEERSEDGLVFGNRRTSDHLRETERHISNKRRKQGARHNQHRKQRLRRNKDLLDDNESDQLSQNENYPHGNNRRQRKHDELEGNDIKESVRRNEEKEDGEDHSNTHLGVEQGHLKQELQLHIRQGQQTGKHVILVRGVQEIEEQEEKQMVLVVVDREENEEHLEQEQPHRIHLKVQQHSENLHKRPRGSSNSDVEEKAKLEENQDLFDSYRSKMTILDLKTPQHLQEHENEQKINQSLADRKETTPLTLQDQLVTYDQEPFVDNLSLKPEQLELKELQKELGGQEEMEEVRQIYGGVEWESDRWGGGKILCQGAAFFTNLVTAASALTVAVIAMDRYLAIVRPLVYGVMVTSGRCLLMLAWCWSQALLTALPPLLGWARYERREPYGRCGVAWEDSPSYTAVWAISVFLIPFSIMVVCYYQILQVARNKCQRIRVGKVSETSPPNTPDPASACLDGFPFPLSVAHLTSPPLGAKPASPLASSPPHRKVSPLAKLSNPPLGNTSNSSPRNIASPQCNGPGPLSVRAMTASEGLESYLVKPLPCRSYSVGGIMRVDSTTNTNDPTIKPKRKLADFGRSRSLCQVPQQPPRPCLRRVQSTFSVRHTLKKLSLGTRRPSWNWEGSPSKGFWTVFVVMGAHILTWGPYTCMAIAEAILGREHLLLLPYWVTVTCTLLLFTASVFYPIVYGLYNRNIRKELVTCLCPSWARKRGSHLRRPSTLPSYSGSVLDFTSIRQRSASDKPGLCSNPANGISGPIATISSTVGSLACPAPLMILGDDSLPARGYNLNLRKPSQDSGTVMVGGDDQDSDVETPAPPQRHYTTRRVSAPSVLSTVREAPHTSEVCLEIPHQVSRHHSANNRNLPFSHRKTPILPLTVELSSARPVMSSSLRRSHSLDKINSGKTDMTLDSRITYRSLRRKRSTPVIRETQFNTPPTSERVTRRRGSVAVVKVMAIPEDCGLPEYPEVTDSGRGSVDSGNISKTRAVIGRGSADSADLSKTFSLRCRGNVDRDLAKVQAFSRRGSIDSTELAMARAISKRENSENIDMSKNLASRQVSIDEGIGGDCLPEETNWE